MTNDKQNKDRVILVRVTETIADEFITHCEKNGYAMSKRLRLIIEKDIKGKIIIND